MSRTDIFIHSVTSSKTYHPDGTVDTAKDPAVWTLAHRGYSGGGRLDVWVYPTKAVALREGAALAMACGMDEDVEATTLFTAGKFTKVMERYEQIHPETHRCVSRLRSFSSTTERVLARGKPASATCTVSFRG